MTVEFGDGVEPWSVARGGVKRWLHCCVDAGALLDDQRDELCAWLAGHDLPLAVPGGAVLVTRDREAGYRVQVLDAWSDVDFEDLPVWIQRPQPAGQPQYKPTGARRDRAVPAPTDRSTEL